MRHPRRSAALATLVLSLMCSQSPRLFAQGEDAIPLRAGTFRIVVAPDWMQWNQRFGRGTPGFADGSLEPLTADFSSDSLGTAQLPALFTTAETLLRQATGLSGYALNLGRARLTLNNSVRVIPIGFDLAISNRLIVRATVPMVRAKAEVFLGGPDTSLAGAATHGNVGINPDLVTPGTYATYIAQVTALLAELETQAASGPVGLRPQAQATIASISPLLCALTALASGNAGIPTCTTGFQSTAGSPVLPIDTSAAGDSILANLTGARTEYNNLRTQYAGQGVALPVFDATFALPASSLDAAGLANALRAPALGAESLQTIVRIRLGDVELGASYQLAAGQRWRSRVDVTLRLPTSTEDSPHNLVDLGTGTGQGSMEIAWRNDAVLRPDFWFHAGVRVGGYAGGQLVRRVAPPSAFFVAIADTATVDRALGKYFQLDLVPNWQLDDAFRVGVGMHWFSQGGTTHTYADPAAATRIGLAASVLDEETANTNLRVGAGVTFSTLNRYATGRASLPYSVSFAYSKTYWGSGGRVPAVSAVNMLIRMYLRLWG